MALPSLRILLAAVLSAVAGSGFAAELSPPYQEVFYASGPLRIQAYLYKPAGGGPFPLIVYNHGSRSGSERVPVPFTNIAAPFTAAGYAVLVAERRGYGRSDGPTATEELGSDIGPRLVARLGAETDDVLAALDFLKTVAFVDSGRLGIMGWSLGGIVTMLAISRSTAFKAAVDQAGGALTWDHSAAVREALEDAARHARAPLMLLVAANDRTTESITAVDRVLTQRNWPHETKIYPPFVPRSGFAGAPGHAIFGREGVAIWRADVIAFLDRHLAK